MNQVDLEEFKKLSKEEYEAAIELRRLGTEDQLSRDTLRGYANILRLIETKNFVTSPRFQLLVNQ